MRNFGIYLTMTCFISLLCQQTFAASNPGAIDKLLELPEQKIDMGIVALTLAKEVYPDINIETYTAKLDELVQNAKAHAKGSSDPDFRIRALNTYLYKVEGFKYDVADPEVLKTENRYLNGILDTKKGSCVTLPLLYLVIAQRLGYPVYAVSAPDHLFLRYVDPKLKEQNIEATGGGGYIADEKYREDLIGNTKDIKSGSYFKTLTYREFMANLLVQNGVYWGRKGDIQTTISYAKKAISINPEIADFYDSLGRAYMLVSKKSDDKIAKEYLAKADDCINKAKELGFVRPPREKYLDHMKQVKEKAGKKGAQ